ncbi:hypothetical protein BD309DRAFT_566274 [Dichomitus squalens]|nr:hypothetical protein BD309DRAFT_566274 [Dichomitus squalens]
MHRVPVRHPNPYIFHPERCLSDTIISAESAHLADPTERDHWSFGIGYISSQVSTVLVLPPRRVSPGVTHAAVLPEQRDHSAVNPGPMESQVGVPSRSEKWRSAPVFWLARTDSPGKRRAASLDFRISDYDFLDRDLCSSGS